MDPELLSYKVLMGEWTASMNVDIIRVGGMLPPFLGIDPCFNPCKIKCIRLHDKEKIRWQMELRPRVRQPWGLRPVVHEGPYKRKEETEGEKPSAGSIQRPQP